MSDVTMEQMEQMVKQLMDQNKLLQEKLQQSAAPTAQQATAVFQAATSDVNQQGLGFMWGQLTGAVGSTASMVKRASDSLDVLAKNGLYAAAEAQMDGATNLCKSMGIEAKGPEAILAADAMVAYILSRR